MSGIGRGHYFGLDAVRCLAIILVLGCHCGMAFSAWLLLDRPRYLPSFGYYGVELFFVLSGFLIGGVLLDLISTRPSPGDWLVFMVRRWMRTLPLYLLWLAILTLTWPPGLMHDQWHRLGEIVPSYVWFGQNLAWAPPDWFTVSWSLSIEEWFYLTFSVLLVLGARIAGSRRTMVTMVGIFLIVPFMLRVSQSRFVDWNEYLHKAVIFRLDAIAFGVSVIALIRMRPSSPRTEMMMLLAGGAMIAAQSGGLMRLEILFGPRWERALGFDVTDLGFALMLPAMLRVPSPPAWVREPVRLFAAQSYGTYLTHYTLIEWVGFARITTHWDGLSSSLGCVALILIIPAIFWHAFEKRVMRLRPTSRRRSRDGRPEGSATRLA